MRNPVLTTLAALAFAFVASAGAQTNVDVAYGSDSSATQDFKIHVAIPSFVAIYSSGADVTFTEAAFIDALDAAIDASSFTSAQVAASGGPTVVAYTNTGGVAYTFEVTDATDPAPELGGIDAGDFILNGAPLAEKSGTLNPRDTTVILTGGETYGLTVDGDEVPGKYTFDVTITATLP